MNNLCKNGLDAQEIAEARKNLCLPQKTAPSKEAFESLGFVFKSIPGDQVLADVTLPVGWSIESHENNPCYTFILDGKGRRRGISYYDDNASERCGQLSLLKRFCIERKSERQEGPYHIVVKDCTNNSIIFSTDKCDVLDGRKYQSLIQQAKNFLDENHPGWKDDPIKYWD